MILIVLALIMCLFFALGINFVLYLLSLFISALFSKKESVRGVIQSAILAVSTIGMFIFSYKSCSRYNHLNSHLIASGSNRMEQYVSPELQIFGWVLIVAGLICGFVAFGRFYFSSAKDTQSQN